MILKADKDKGFPIEKRYFCSSERDQIKADRKEMKKENKTNSK